MYSYSFIYRVELKKVTICNLMAISSASACAEPNLKQAEMDITYNFSEKARDIIKDRYCVKATNETIAHAMWRVASTVAGAGIVHPTDLQKDIIMQTAKEYFSELLVKNRFIPNTPTWTGAGTRLAQLAACFVLPIDDTMESIFDTLKDAAMIQRSGGGVGFCFGNLRPAGALVESSGGQSSGPISFLTAYDAVFQSVAQGCVCLF